MEQLSTHNSQLGTLVLVATPIGNLQDISLRAIDALRQADLIACEDTRHSATLLRAHGIARPTTSYHGYSPADKGVRLLDEVAAGKRVAVISDAGLPGISDPGAALVRDAIARQLPVEVIPGASASLMALVLSGLPTGRFTFEGFLPVKPGPRRRRLEALRDGGRTAVVYESPHRLLKALDDIEAVYGDIGMACCRELTKQFEETRREPVSRLREHFAQTPPRGEFVLVLPPLRVRSDGE